MTSQGARHGRDDARMGPDDATCDSWSSCTTERTTPAAVRMRGRRLVSRGDGKLPVLPSDYCAYYCTTADSYLASGAEDVAVMRWLLAKSGALAEEAGRILELGCAGGE